MGITTKVATPLVSSTGFDVAPVSVTDEAGYTGIFHASTGDWILGSSMPKGRALCVHIATGAAASSPTGLQVGLCVDSDANGGTSPAFVAGTTTEWANPAGDTQYVVEIPLSYVSDLTKYYSIGLALKGGGSATLLAGTVTTVLDPTYEG